MTVLIVDDQVSVVEGILQGIDWEKINASRIYKAYNALDAKEIIQKEKIDILLCDIEMPGENGLQLFQWIKEHGFIMECIFLTAHADFEFAREAVRLGGFDYVLQPARYEEIQNVMIRAKQKIYVDIETKKYSSYGKILYQNKEILIDGILRKWLCEEGGNSRDATKELQKFSIELRAEELAYYVLISLHKKSEKSEQLDLELLRYMLYNVLSELFTPFHLCVLLAGVGTNKFGMILYAEQDGVFPASADIKETLSMFMGKLKEFFGIDAACYGENQVQMSEIAMQARKLEEYQCDNVSQISKVFWGREAKSSGKSVKLPDDMKNWYHALAGGNSKKIRAEAYEFLKQDLLDAEILKIFYREFMQTVAGAVEQLGISTHQIFADKDSMQKSLVAYRSVELMKNLIDFVADSFAAIENGKEVNYVETVIQYINCNIEKDIRRNEIAAIVNLNEDYLSRIFKKEKGISLKEFILSEKMKVAQTLLRTTTFSIGTIAIKVGFTNFSHFSQTYRKLMGMNPAEERRP